MVIGTKRLFNLVGHFFLGIFLGLIFLFFSTGVFILAIGSYYNNLIYPGVFVLGEDFSGKTPVELETFLRQKETSWQDRQITFFWQETGQAWTIKANEVSFALNREETVSKAFSLGRNPDWQQRLTEIYHLLTKGQTVNPGFLIDQPKMTAWIEEIAKGVDLPVEEGLFEFKDGRVINFRPAKDGRKLDREKIKEEILEVFLSQPLEEKNSILPLPVLTVAPKIVPEQSNNLGIKELLGVGESFFYDSIPSRVHNLVLAATSLHGILIAPQETFSFAEKIGEISSQKGYQQAYVIKQGKTTLEDGGGVCQVSTTLFRAALNTGLPIIERQAHLYRVGFYEQGGYPPGLDATVYPPSPDLKFLNDTPGYLLIQTKVDKEQKKLSFLFYGTSDGRRVEMEKPVIHSQTPPPEPIYVDEPNLPAGTVKKIDSAHWGAKVSFNWKVYYASGGLKEERTFWSSYVPWPAVYQRGTKTS